MKERIIFKKGNEAYDFFQKVRKPDELFVPYCIMKLKMSSKSKLCWCSLLELTNENGICLIPDIKLFAKQQLISLYRIKTALLELEKNQLIEKQEKGTYLLFWPPITEEIDNGK